MASITEATTAIEVGTHGWLAKQADVERRTVEVYRALTRDCDHRGEAMFYARSASLHAIEAERLEDLARRPVPPHVLQEDSA
jgi:ActR/RegA family two-component response regulator